MRSLQKLGHSQNSDEEESKWQEKRDERAKRLTDLQAELELLQKQEKVDRDRKYQVEEELERIHHENELILERFDKVYDERDELI